MRITCPSCTTSYTIADDKIGAKGRSVRCASCGTKWLATLQIAPADSDPIDIDRMGADPEPSVTVPTATETQDSFASQDDPFFDVEPAASPEPVPISALRLDYDKPSTSGSDPAKDQLPDVDLDAQLADINKRKDIESLSKKPKIKVSKKKPAKVRKPFKFDMDRFLVRARPVFGALVLATSFGVIGMAMMFRISIVSAFPSLASLYGMIGMPVNLRGLEIGKLQMLREVDNAQPVLVVEGELINPTTVDREVPAIRFALRGDDAQEIYAWSIEPKMTALIPGANMRFRTRLASPPEQAADIQVRMIDRRNRQATLNE